MRLIPILLIIGCFVLAGCEHDDHADNQDEAMQEEEEQRGEQPMPDLPEPQKVVWDNFVLETYLTVNDQVTNRVTRSQTAVLHLKIHYLGNTSTNIVFTSAQNYDFYINDKNDNRVWCWAADKVFAEAVEIQTIKTNELLEYSVEWPVKTQSGNRALRGTYTLEAIWTTSQSPPHPGYWFVVR